MSDHFLGSRAPGPWRVEAMEAAPESWMKVEVGGREVMRGVRLGRWSASASSVFCVSFCFGLESGKEGGTQNDVCSCGFSFQDFG